MEAEDSVRAGYPVKMTGNGKVGFMYGQRSIFVVLHSMSEMVLQQYSCRNYYSGLPYTGSGMKVGILKLGATSDKAEVSETGKECLVVDIDSESSTCGIIL